MPGSRSFKEYVKDKCYNDLYETAENYVADNWESMDLYTRNVHRIGSVDMVDASIERVYVQDLPGTRLALNLKSMSMKAITIMMKPINAARGFVYTAKEILPAVWMTGR